MAPVDIETQSGYLPLVVAGLRIVSAAYASLTVGRSLYRSHKALGPAQDTRHRTAERSKLTVAFGSLAALGLVFAVTSSLDHLSLSYKVWASERGVEPLTTESLFGNSTLSTKDAMCEAGAHLSRWLSDTPVYMDAMEIVAEQTRRLWWGQQLDLATVSWTALLAIEGRRRRIPHLWAYAVLPHLVSLSFAQNLFHVAMLQAPVPMPTRETRLARLVHRLLPKKPKNWLPKLSLIAVPLTFYYAALLWLPIAAGKPTFPATVVLAKLFSLAALILPAVAPASWGHVYSDPRDAYPGISKLFNIISAASGLMYAKTTVSAVLYNLPGSRKHRHSIKIPFDTVKRSKWERTATAAEKILDSLTDHPVVAGAGKDALLCALSLGLWAAVRGTDVATMLRQVFPTPTLLRRAATKAASHVPKAEPAALEASPSHHAPGFSMRLRHRGRPKKTSVSSISSFEAANEDTHQTPKRRGRPRKVKLKPEPEPDLELDEAPGDETYEPTPAAKADLVLADVLPDDDFDWESASLAWGLAVLGGLGVGSAAVYGAESVSR
ncbi:uncharacterized protein B0T15DRAFT_487429 [Chaetomium strumarium]|uniref:Uncharacterized protein n=1 Tax=Chaetomium strumarium TaxID=1170767 RepID=A0AAJ0GLM5_9PEZI|nr:hypothetical protein B0T15DRAFT_487429 [Chaetomium strumarium]